MDKYNKLLTLVSQTYGIPKGTAESESDWKIRIIYSICGMMAYTSFWDDAEEEQISILHLKKRVKNILSSYREMYPEVADELPSSSQQLEDELANIFLNTGVAYHCPYRIAPSIRREESIGNICFQRGILPNDIKCVSGVGFYSIQDESNHRGNIRLMFGLEEQNLSFLWETAQSSASWKAGSKFDMTTEYLRTSPPFFDGYWTHTPDTTGRSSILRTGMKGTPLYYLYKYMEGRMEISQLPQWQVEGNNYLTLANACLSSHGALPPIEYTHDGEIAHIRLNYLLPPKELEFLKLYSWPSTYSSLPCNFKRKCSSTIFRAIKNILTEEGYLIKER